MGLWFRDIIREATFEGKHTQKVKDGIKLGFILFIISEVMFFFGFFFAFFYTSLDPSIFLGHMYPPITFDTIYPGTIPLFATFVLLLSSATITTAHSSIIENVKSLTIYSLFATLFLAVMFTFIQYQEYINASFTISDGIVGSNFFMITGLHGFHVIIGSIFILVSTFRFFDDQFSQKRHLGFELCVWYWHFVDVVWFFVMFFIYFLGGGWLVIA
jgi:cytochrome c oxidase subunit 3